MKFSIVAAIIFKCITLNINAQEFISASYNYGDNVVHSPAISNLVNRPVHGFTINYAVSNKKDVDWRKPYNFSDY
ncbi:MAG: hypothetical protein JXR61_12195 [Prolixibacteraceae bacterium]|nr:hypothetical protein [Prolixibacteraceae bacterium]